MSEDLVMDEIVHEAKAQREEDEADTRWMALADGTISDADHAALRALAETSEEARQRYALYRPIDDDQRAELVAQALAALRPVHGVKSPKGPAVLEPSVPRAARDSSARARPPHRWLPRFAGLAATAAVAIVAMTQVLRPKPFDVPSYTIELNGGIVIDRGEKPRDDPGAKKRIRSYTPSALIDLTLRPESPVQGRVDFRAFLVREGRIVSLATPPHPELASTGAVHVSERADTLFRAAPGEWTLVVFVGSPKALEEHADEIARAPLQAADRLARDLVVARKNLLVAGDEAR